MNRSWVRFPQAAQIRPPGTGWAFLYVCAVSRCCLWPRWCSGRRRARPPARLGDLTSFGAAPRSPPVPSGPSGALHTCGAGSLMCGLARRLKARPGPATAHRHRGQATPLPTGTAAKPRRSPWASQGPRALRFLADLLCVVTNVVNRRCFSCGFLIRCYKRRQSEGFFAENQGFWTQIDDVCNRSPHKVL